MKISVDRNHLETILEAASEWRDEIDNEIVPALWDRSDQAEQTSWVNKHSNIDHAICSCTEDIQKQSKGFTHQAIKNSLGASYTIEEVETMLHDMQVTSQAQAPYFDGRLLDRIKKFEKVLNACKAQN